MGISPSNISQRKRKKKEEKEENAISVKFLVINIRPLYRSFENGKIVQNHIEDRCVEQTKNA